MYKMVPTGRCDQADGQVQDHDDTKDDGVDARGLDHRNQNGPKDQNIGRQVHDHAHDEQKQVDHQQQRQWVGDQRSQQRDHLGGDLGHGDEPADGPRPTPR